MAILVSVLFIAYLFSTRITSVSLAVAGDNRASQTAASQYQSELLSLAQRHIFGINVFVDKYNISQQFGKKYPEVSSVKLSIRPFSNTLYATLDFRRPALIWQTGDGKRLYLDSDGKAFEHNYSTLTDDDLVRVLDTSGIIAQQGQTVATSETITFVTELNNRLHKDKIVVSGYVIPKSVQQLNVQLQGKQYVIKLLTTGDVGQAVAQIEQSLSYFKEHPDQTPKKYLDLRITGRGYYQ